MKFIFTRFEKMIFSQKIPKMDLSSYCKNAKQNRVGENDKSKTRRKKSNQCKAI